MTKAAKSKTATKAKTAAQADARVFPVETRFQKMAKREGGVPREKAIEQAQNEIEGAGVGSRMIELPPAFDLGNVGGESARDPTRDGVLKLENIGKLAIVAIAPHHRAGL